MFDSKPACMIVRTISPSRVRLETSGLVATSKEEGHTQEAAAERFGVSQPRISDLVNRKIDIFSIAPATEVEALETEEGGNLALAD